MEWSQLIYASTGASSGRSGGWGILEESPGISADVRSELEQGIATRFDEVTPTDEFADREVLEARDRRLTFRPTSTGGGAWWHAVAAGLDATGRPGNVFTHAVLIDEAVPNLRPIDYWLSPDWLMPFGARKVDSSALGVFGSPGSLRDIDPLQVPFERPDQAEAVLSAVTYCFEEDWPLLLVGSTDEFVGWLRAVCYLTAHSASWKLPFSTYVRGSECDNLDGGAFQILRVPRGDLDEVLSWRADGGRGLVLDLANLPSAKEADESWTHHGQRWRAGQWWQDAFWHLNELQDSEPDQVAVTLAAMDEVTPSLPTEGPLAPEWSLALAHFRRAGYGYGDAERLVADWTKLAPWSSPVVDELMAEAPGQIESWAPSGSIAQDVWASLENLKLNPSGSDPQVVDLDGEMSWEDLVALVAEVARGQVMLAKTDDSALREARLLWLAVLPLLVAPAPVAEEARRGRVDAILVVLGLCPVELASEQHKARADEVITLAPDLPTVLVNIVRRWLAEYEQGCRMMKESADE